MLAKITPFDESDETDFEAYAARQSWSLAKMLATHGSNKSIEDELMRKPVITLFLKREQKYYRQVLHGY